MTFESFDDRPDVRFDRRSVIRSVGATALALGLAGCTTTGGRTHEAGPVSLDQEAAELGYALRSESTIETEREVEQEDETVDVTLVGRLVSYERDGEGFADSVTVGAASTPAGEAIEVSPHPMAEEAVGRLLTDEAGEPFLSQLALEPTWSREPERVRTGEGTLFGSQVEFQTFAGVTRENELALLNVVRVMDDDDAVLVGEAHTKAVEDADTPLVGADGLVTERAVDAEVVQPFVELLPLVVRAEPEPFDGEPDDELAGREEADPENQLHSATLEGARVTDHEVTEIPEAAFDEEEIDVDEEDIPEWEPETIHPLVEEWLDERPADETEQLVVNFRDDIDLPRFPEPAVDEPRDSETNREIRARTEELIEEIEGRRREEYERLGRQLREYEAEVLDQFWLVQAVLVEMPLGNVRALADREDVLYVEPEETGEMPPSADPPAERLADGEGARVEHGEVERTRVDHEDVGASAAMTQHQVGAARDMLDTDPYYNLGLDGGYIGLMDTGVRESHQIFSNPNNLGFIRDCVNGIEANCSQPADQQEPGDDHNHGTKTAGIISGSDALGEEYRGVTEVTLDSFDVYPGDGGLSTAATLRAIEASLALLGRVLVAEMQSSSNENGSISTAADNAYDCGAVIIAANGNNGPDEETVNAPANARKAIGIGAFHIQTENQYTSQSRGPTGDGRIKPDVQAPNSTETASAQTDTAVAPYGGTSGATPYGAGAATLLRNWLRNSFCIDPGQVYAQLILSGQDTFPFDNTTGAGPLNLPTNGWAWWGQVTLSNAERVDITLSLDSSWDTFDVACWWPKNTDRFRVVWLQLIDPNGAVRASSTSLPSVFQRARENGDIESGDWTLRITHYVPPAGPPQRVYYAAHVE